MGAVPIQGLSVADLDQDQPFGERMRACRAELNGVSVWKFVFEPGWRYTEHVEPDLCVAPHVGFIAQGTLHLVMADGAEADAGPGTAVAIEPGHDAWTVGDEPCVLVDFAENLA